MPFLARGTAVLAEPAGAESPRMIDAVLVSVVVEGPLEDVVAVLEGWQPGIGVLELPKPSVGGTFQSVN